MAQRISRAKRTSPSRASRSPCPTRAASDDRLAPVLRVVYLVFNEGYATSHGAELARADLADRSDPSGPPPPRAPARRPRGDRAPCADAADRGPPSGPHDGRRARWSRSANRTAPLGPRPHRGGHRTGHAAPSTTARWASTRRRRRSPRCTTRAPSHEDTDWRRDPVALHAARAPDRQPGRAPQPGRGAGDGRRARVGADPRRRAGRVGTPSPARTGPRRAGAPAWRCRATSARPRPSTSPPPPGSANARERDYLTMKARAAQLVESRCRATP